MLASGSDGSILFLVLMYSDWRAIICSVCSFTAGRNDVLIKRGDLILLSEKTDSGTWCSWLVKMFTIEIIFYMSSRWIRYPFLAVVVLHKGHGIFAPMPLPSVLRQLQYDT